MLCRSLHLSGEDQRHGKGQHYAGQPAKHAGEIVSRMPAVNGSRGHDPLAAPRMVLTIVTIFLLCVLSDAFSIAEL